MAKTDRGTKRQCLSCATKFYDLNRDPIICPKCGAEFVTQMAAAKAVEKEIEEEAVVDEVETDSAATAAGAEIVSLDEADAEEGDDDIKNLPDVDLEDDDEDINTDDNDVFLEEDDDDDNIGIDVPIKKDED
ncbi:TIGR02300 family protein [Maritalea mediterranea]|uniref:TIGR02300 family protein n=1 Tax=Maritalea mediterranea TaxID=2909667 RepID=A0ABS9E5M4_9HYPH|nr:TIGR02300 family protein [Maritalea mediterranea]